MAERPQSDNFILAIKAATRDLVRLCGGVERAGEIADKSKASISRFQTVEAPEIIDLSSALALERECGVPCVTKVMAEMHGRRLSDEMAAASASSVLKCHADLMQRSAATAALIAMAMADHTITPAEAEAIDRSLAEEETSVRAMRATLAAVRALGATPAGAVPGLRAV